MISGMMPTLEGIAVNNHFRSRNQCEATDDEV